MIIIGAVLGAVLVAGMGVLLWGMVSDSGAAGKTTIGEIQQNKAAY